MDGILIGNIVEILTAQAYGITLYRQSESVQNVCKKLNEKRYIKCSKKK